MKNKNFLAVVFLLPLALSCCSSKENSPSQSSDSGKQIVLAKEPESFFKKGETMTYAIKSLGVKIGSASLAFEGKTSYNGRGAFLLVFKAAAVNFFDEERIYADTETFYPLAVERDLNIWGKKEKITEEYNQQKGTIEITKVSGGQTTQQRIEKAGLIDNIYCFIYRYRKSGRFNLGDSFAVKLPTKDIVIKLTKQMQLRTAGKTYDAYYMESDPAEYKLWFDTSPVKIPLRINGAMGINDTAITMVEYAQGK